MEKISPQWAIWALSWYAFLMTSAETVTKKLTEFSTAFADLFRGRYFVLFKFQPYAVYRVGHINTWATGSARPEWLYSPEEKRFYQWNTNVFDTISMSGPITLNPVPILSMELVSKDEKVQYDLTEFLEDIRVQNHSAVKVFPSISHILGIWTLHSGILIDPSRFTVRFMDENAESFQCSVFHETHADEAEPVAATEPESPPTPVAGGTAAPFPAPEAGEVAGTGTTTAADTAPKIE